MIDNITYNDLELDKIIQKLNYCKTSCGEEFITSSIYNPHSVNRDDFIYLINNTEAIDADKALSSIGKLKKYTFDECLNKLLLAEQKGNGIHYASGIIVILAFAMIFIHPGIGLLSLFGTVGASLYLYFKEQSISRMELYAFSYISKMARVFKYVKSDDAIGIKLINEGLNIKNDLKPLINGAFLIKSNQSTDGNPIDVILDYLRMIFHVDLIKYNNVLKCIKDNEKSINRLFEIYGLIDASVSIRKYRDSLIFYSEPKFTDSKTLKITDCFHPLIQNPVYNSIDTDKSVLITGSNASGKSTFLKTVALCIIFSESFGFSFSKDILIPKCSVFTSMALRDDIESAESYFIKEIKALKRIVDASNNDEFIICFVDEVLRGTNTIERIAAAKEILSNLNKSNTLIFAATHDLELATLLSLEFSNYHFTEEINENDIVFPYKLCEGETKTRNAIKLLELMGFDLKTVKDAEKLVDNYVKNGVWA